MPSTEGIETMRAEVAQACRILAVEGVVDGILGHVSVRVGDDRMLIRCRGPREHGLLFTEQADIRLVDFDGQGAELTDGYAVPNELPIHGEAMRARPEVGAVVHAHPPAVLACGVAGLPLRPIFGSFNIPAMRMAHDGIPLYPRSVLIRRPELAKEMLAAMGDRPVCVLRGHGITVTGATVREAVMRALNLNVLATVTLAVAQTGRIAEDIPPDDLAELPDLGSAFNDDANWRYYAAKAEAHLR
ncbi:MAG TPA: class II aldolase/adducin family protein [Pseudonocardiaceae bacterium]|jgi:ribulose-5-phosphate 4-epimerase/fuculose-1-phosphate aldolase|nr:class II aldolase/adducin family protein [Pseudonocardiaceae bacterium]